MFGFVNVVNAALRETTRTAGMPSGKAIKPAAAKNGNGTAKT